METSIAIIKKGADEYLVHGQFLEHNAREIAIFGLDGLNRASEILKDCQTTEKEIEATRVTVTKPINDFIGAVNQLFKQTVAPTLEAKAIIKTKIVKYNEDQERIRRDAELKRMAEERERLEKLEAERKERERIERERQAVEDARLKAIADQQNFAQQALERERLDVERKQRELEALKRDQDEFERLKKEREEREAIAVKQAAETKVKGIVKSWQYEVVAADVVPSEFCSPDDKKISAAIKAGVREIAGVLIYQSTSVR